MTTYADLLTGTASHVRLCESRLRTEPFTSREEALGAIVDFRDTLRAIASHTRKLLWPAQTQPMDLALPRDYLTRDQVAAVALIRGIEDHLSTPRVGLAGVPTGTTSWARPAQQLRAASDLLATHFDLHGRARTPDADAALDPHQVEGALHDLGALTTMVLAGREPLALRAHEAGVNRVAVRVIASLDLGRISDLTRTLSTTTHATASVELDSLDQTWTPTRRGDPVMELGDRMRRLRQTTWDLTTTGSGAIATLRNAATIGIAVHAHTAAFHGADLTAIKPHDPGAPRGTEALVERARAWQQLHRRLSEFAALTPAPETVRDDLHAILRLLPALAPLDTATNRAASTDPAARRIGSALNGAVTAMTDIGRHSAASFRRIARQSTLHIDARHAPRETITDNPRHVAARLNGRTIPAPAACTDLVLAVYDHVATHPITAVDSSPALQTSAPDRGRRVERPVPITFAS